jgi:hypothetical protein
MALSHKRMMAKKAKKAAARKGKTYQPKQKYVVMAGQAVPQRRNGMLEFADSNTALVDEIKIS